MKNVVFSYNTKIPIVKWILSFPFFSSQLLILSRIFRIRMKDSEKEGNQEEGREGREPRGRKRGKGTKRKEEREGMITRVMMKDVSHCGKNVFLFVSSIHFPSLPYPNNLVFILLFLLFCRIQIWEEKELREECEVRRESGKKKRGAKMTLSSKICRKKEGRTKRRRLTFLFMWQKEENNCCIPLFLFFLYLLLFYFSSYFLVL